MRPALVISPQCHLWTDALHLRQLCREARNRWDRGTYVRSCVSASWSVLEVSCNDALGVQDIGYSFRQNLDRAVASRGLPALDWSGGVWQRVAALQALRKDYVHRFLTTPAVFPNADVAEKAVSCVRDAILEIYSVAGAVQPTWALIDAVHGFQERSSFGVVNSCQVFPGVKADDPDAVRVCVVAQGQEYVTGIFPPGHSTDGYVQNLVSSTKVPLEGIRVYDGDSLMVDLVVTMRGN